MRYLFAISYPRLAVIFLAQAASFHACFFRQHFFSSATPSFLTTLILSFPTHHAEIRISPAECPPIFRLSVSFSMTFGVRGLLIWLSASLSYDIIEYLSEIWRRFDWFILTAHRAFRAKSLGLILASITFSIPEAAASTHAR
jgi:hypothetical protein